MKKLILLIICLSFINCSKAGKSKVQPDSAAQYPHGSIHLSLGVPVDGDSSDDYLIIREQYVISYNKSRNVANWVSWELNRDWYGDAKRYNKFMADSDLPDGLYLVKTADYAHSGYDRGHMVRSEERTRTEEDNKVTFYMTNILPQKPDLNQGVWLRFENYLEKLCKNDDKELFLIAGGIFHSDTRINDLVAIPDSCFKIVVILDRGEGLKDITEKTTVIAIVMPNIDGVREDDWPDYKTTVRRIEYSTGYDFLNLVPKRIQDVIENK
jgi:endonuclease G, mitochondrial